MYSLENLHNIEVLVFSNYAFSLEVLLNHEKPSHYVRVSLTTHEVVLAIAVWEKCFGFMVRPQRPDTHVSFKKLAPGSWRVTLQGSRQNILKLLLATGFDIIRFQVDDLNAQVHALEEAFFGYSIRVPLSKIASKVDIFLKELKDPLSIVSDPEASSPPPPSLSASGNRLFGVPPRREDTNVSRLSSSQNPSNTIEIYRSHPASVASQEILVHKMKPKDLETESEDGFPGWGRVPLRTMHDYSDRNENTNAFSNENLAQVTETIRLSKSEVSAIIGPQGKRIDVIREATHCRISVLPVTLETMNSRFRTQEFPQTISLKGKPHQVAQAKVMLRRALLECRSK
ncbi:hypothetical protein METBIDRAFT_12930 [Metschnikowia bicuspidata var. bicuspidata NRRL YB-4993]|uniref:K Homology domain-containing protein n=1 Tax=Metschnikowia bicuspidata var. bicuspidata NRRL YB-4993 TaxID=869754 RepID=A0A1A0H7M8_9ASCO|nr:hypothetical protein METBIDRAFT_12930 [Metschnikowia bicuspidata var. bicuspidata NRRL YB-4993]OBA19897.1 hypothetical protein METBIDRAFT_12930 [Metschnikowia bicuspidata var. bicuspidata NRRL YB-4993]